MRVRLAATLAALTLVLAGLVAVSASTATSSDVGNSLSSSRGNGLRLGNSLVVTVGTTQAAGLANGMRADGLLVMPLATSGANSARIRHRSDSAVSSIRACKDAASSSACASGSATTYLSRNETTPAGDWDGYWCPTGRTCRTYFGPVYNSYGPISSGPRFVKVSGCAGCTKSVRVM